MGLNRNKCLKLKDFGRKGIVTWNKIIIGLLLFILFVVVLGGAYYDMAVTYDVPVSDQYSKFNSKIASITNKTTEIGNQFEGSKVTTINALVISTDAAFAGLQIILSSISIPIELARESYISLPFIPKIFVTILTAIITLVFIGIVGSAFMRWIA